MNQDLPIAVIGAGFSGTMTALHLLKRVAASRVLLCERGRTFGRGVAYSTCSPCHLLNVRAANMSAFPDEPDHFATWLAGVMAAPDADLRCHVRETEVGTFVSRDLYGRYLASLLSGAIRDSDGAERLTLVGDEVVDLEPCAGGYRLVLAGGRSLAVSHAVLATGNLLPDARRESTYITNPWSCGFADELEADRPVVILGTGLTMVDIATQLRATGFSGPVIAISRRGLQPRSHAATMPWPTPTLSQPEQSSVHALLRRVRREVAEAADQGVAWQSVIDSLRPLTARLWQDLPAWEQARFLRHLRPWWDVHRHRAAPPVAQEIEHLVAKGWLQFRAGRILGIEAGRRKAVVRYRPRRGSEVVALEAQRIIDATGIAAPTRCGDRLLSRLLDRGLIRPDRHSLGLDVAPDLRAIGATGAASPGLWALGPMVRGVFWECTAVPDIRCQARDLADHIADALGRERAPASDVRAA
jgi:uncharacterized NAD(P)/FAD-binding protein YdhS